MAWSNKKRCKKNKILMLHYRGVAVFDICARLDTKRAYVLRTIKKLSCQKQKASFRLSLSMGSITEFSKNEMNYGTHTPIYTFEEVKSEYDISGKPSTMFGAGRTHRTNKNKKLPI